MAATMVLAKRYRVVQELGRGGMGVVYRVVDTLDADRELALKTLKAEYLDKPAVRWRLREEFRTKASLRHPNTVSVLDYGALDETTQYLLMEYVEGDSLRELIARAPLTAQAATDYLQQLLLALRFIHARHFVHRDVKPENVRITPQGVLKLMDFGLMQQLGRLSSGRLEGTVGYIAPEVLHGGVIDEGTDLYAVGCLAFEMLTGRTPFAGEPELTLRGVCARPPPPLAACLPGVPFSLTAVVERLLQPDPRKRYRTADEVLDDLAPLSGALSREGPAQRKSYLATSWLVGRGPELQRLKEALAEVAAGAGRSIFIGAPAGVGKSRLAHELVVQAKLDGVLVLQAQCRDGAMAPNEALQQALRSLLAVTPPETMMRLSAQLERFGPRLARGFSAPGDPAPADAMLELQQLVSTWLREVSERQPILLHVEDLHWCDAQSLEVFNLCIRTLRTARVFCLATFRSDETAAGSAVWLTIADGCTQHLSIGSLGPEDTTRLVAAMLPNVQELERLATTLYGATGGNPFFVTEGLRHLIEEGVLSETGGCWRVPPEMAGVPLPDTVEATLRRRLQHLGAQARKVGQVAAIIGQRQEAALLMELCGLPEERLAQGIEELVARPLLTREDAGSAFPHDRGREGLYADVGEEERSRLHQRCGEALEGDAGERLPAFTNQLAHHFARGLDLDRAFRWCRRAGDEARASGQEGVALAWWERADGFLEQLSMAGKEALQARLWWDIGTVGCLLTPALAARAMERFLRLLAAADGSENEAKELEAWVWLAAAYSYSGAPSLGIRTAEYAFNRAGGAEPLGEGALLALGIGYYVSGRFDEMAAVVSKACAHAATPTALGESWAMSGFLSASSAFQGRRLQDPVDERTLGAAGIAQALWCALTGRHAQALDRLDAAARACRQAGAGPHQLALFVRPLLHWQRGEWEEALALVKHAMRFPNECLFHGLLISILHGQLLGARGEHAAAEAILRGALEVSRRQEMLVATLRARMALGELGMARALWHDAEAHLREAYALSSAGAGRNPLHQALAARMLGDVALARGDLDAAGRAYEESLALVCAPDQDNLIEQGRTLRALGRVSLASGQRPAGIAALERACELFRQIGNTYEIGQTLMHLEPREPGTAPPGREAGRAPAVPGSTLEEPE